MKTRNRFLRTSAWLLVILCTFVTASAQQTRHERKARQILDGSGVKGGLVVHVGCGDGRLTAALRANDGYMVHGLDEDPANVEKARDHICSLNLYGKVSADRFDGRRLPYIDNLVNLAVVEDLGDVPRAELMRVLAPNGVAYIRKGDTWTKTTKPWREEMDEWTHYLYDSSNNAVSHDLTIEPPRHLQWVGSPRYSRHHDHMSGASAMVSAGGRLFYIFDHGNPLSVQLPSRWRLVARDAYNGTVLWDRPIEKWHTQMFRLKSGPAQLTRRLVAVGDHVYVTLDIEAPVSALDAVTGKTTLTYEGSAGTEEILVSDGTLFAMINDDPFRQPLDPKAYNYNWPEGPRRIAAYEVGTGKLIWSRPQTSVLPLTLCADQARVIFHDSERVVCLDRRTGKPLWRSRSLAWRRPLPTSFVPTLVLYRDVVLFSGGGEADKKNRFRPVGNIIFGLSAKDGRELWNAPHPPSGHRTAQETLVVGGLVWTPIIAHGTDSGEMIGRDPWTGEVKKTFLPDVETHWFHHRCYRAKATDKYILTSRTGIEFIDPKTEHWVCNHWVRGACLYGIMPANGMIYNPPHPCACYLEAKLYGFNALAGTSESRRVPRQVPLEGRLERGPAYGKVTAKATGRARATGDWPTYRSDAARSGYTDTPVPAQVGPKWQRKLGGRLSSLVVAQGKVFVASVDTHMVHGLDADSGQVLWSYTTGGRVDSPPTVWNGRVLFGSADGYVYCLRADDGALVWRFRAAPMDRRMCNFEQIESVWPVHGSVLVRDSELWCVAGRSMFVDGGLRLLRLDPASGRLIDERIMDDKVPGSDDNLQVVMQRLNMPVALPDILSADDKYVYMRSQRFDFDGVRQEIEVPTLDVSAQWGEGPHLFSPTGFLDDVWWHRSYWVYGRVWKSGAGGYSQAGRVAPAGRPMVFNDTTIYGYGRKPQYYRWTTPLEYQLFATPKQPKRLSTAAKKRQTRGGLGRLPKDRIAFDWTEDVPILVRAMVLAKDTLFIAGAPDVVDEEQSLQTFDQAATQKQLARQLAAYEGSEGAILWAASVVDGRKLAAHKLESMPVFDGMAAAGGSLYMTTTDGKVLCLAEDK